MDAIPTLREQDIRGRVGVKSYERGRQYARGSAIFEARRQGKTLKARCQGSLPEPYLLHVTFDEQGIVDADCSCPVGDGGYCKHIAALLLTWQEQPDAFVEVEAPEVALQRRSKAELIILIKLMLRQRPELEWLLETSLPTGKKPQSPPDRDAYRRQVQASFRRGGDEWGAEAGIAAELRVLVEIGATFARQQDFPAAFTVYEAVASTVLEYFDQYADEDGDLGDIIRACVTGLGSCLAGVDDPVLRGAILTALFAVYHYDVDYGGPGIGEDAPDLIMAHATMEERHMVADWVRAALPTGNDWTANYHRQVYGAFLLELEADTLDDERFLQVCRETGRTYDLVERLLTLERVEDAVAAAQNAGDYELLTLADLFVQHQRGQEAEQLVLERAQRAPDVRLLEWLKRRYTNRGEHAPALRLAEQMFRIYPTLDGYREVRRSAQNLDRWDNLRPKMFAFLRERSQSALMVQVYLDEGLIDQALEAVKPAPEAQPGYGYGPGYYGHQLQLEVAQAAETTRPQAALDIYRDVAESLIAQRGRDNYQSACQLLRRMRTLYGRLDDSQTWANYLADLRERTRSLRALKEELAAAGL